MTSSVVPIKFVVGSRKLIAVPRNLLTVSFGLDDLIGGAMPKFPSEDANVDGYRVLSAPADAIGEICAGKPGHMIGGLQSYCRYYIDMAGSFDAYLARFSSKTRSTFGRKRRKLAEHSGGALDVREYRSPDEIRSFLQQALPLSQLTYQTKLLDAGLPESEAAIAEMLSLAGQDRIRAYLLFIGGRAVSYLYLPIEAGIVSYAFLGYDPEFAHLSPGTVLQLEAMERLFGEGTYRYFDFTEGQGAHKSMFSTDSIEACSFFLLKTKVTNQLLLGSLDVFDSSVALAKRLAERSGALVNVRRMLRG